MKNDFNYLNEADAIALLNSDNVSAITLSRGSSGIESLSIDGVEATVSKKLGSGGSKEVYDVTISDHSYALALPGTVDHVETIIQKWRKVLQEPDNTDRLRDLGFYVNDFCRIIPVIVNGDEFPALIMRRYSDHDFPIYDSKNPQGRYHELIKMGEQVTDESALLLFASIGDEITNLIKSGAKLGRDCINLCDIDGVPHLYINDLGAAKFEKIPDENLKWYVDHYISAVLGAFVNTVTEEAYRENPYVHSIGDLGCPLQSKLVERVMGILK